MARNYLLSREPGANSKPDVVLAFIGYCELPIWAAEIGEACTRCCGAWHVQGRYQWMVFA